MYKYSSLNDLPVKQKSLFRSLIFFIALHLCSCSTISTFHAETFTRTSTLKAKTVVLMDHATDQYNLYEVKVDDILIEAENLYAIQKAREKNNVSAAQWKLLMEKDNSILKGFFKQWKRKGSLSESVIGTFKDQVSTAFDEILKLEGNKLKS